MITITAKDSRRYDKKTAGLFGTGFESPIYFETRTGIHTFLMKKSIVVVILDEDSVIQRIDEVRPNRIFLWNPKFMRVVEIPNSPDFLKDLKVGLKVEVIFTSS